MKSVLLALLGASAAAQVIDSHGSESYDSYDKSKCRIVKQERPVCKDVKREVKHEIKLTGEKQVCSFREVPVHRQIHVDVRTDSCKPNIVTQKNSRPVHLNNKICDYGKDKKAKPDCRIERETRYIDSYDKVTNWHCSEHLDKETIDVKLHVSVEECKPQPVHENKFVVVEVKEKKCHVEKVTREVCDGKYSDGKGEPSDYNNKGEYSKENAAVVVKDTYLGYDSNSKGGHGHGGSSYSYSSKDYASKHSKYDGHGGSSKKNGSSSYSSYGEHNKKNAYETVKYDTYGSQNDYSSKGTRADSYTDY